LSGAAAAILLAGAAAAFLLARPHAQASVARVSFAAQSYPGGLSITQLWTLGGPDGSSLRVSMTVSNASGKAVTAQLAEPIPAQVVLDRQSVTFAGAATPLATRPLVVWDLHLPARGHEVVSYQAHEPYSGVSRQRLLTYTRAYVNESPLQELQVIAHPGLVWKVRINPHKLLLTVGHAGRLTARGRLYDGHLAPPADMAGAIWTSANPAVAEVSRSGRVVAMSPGMALVWVQIGGVRARATVIVSGTRAAPPAYHSQPPVQPSTSPSPTSSVSPSPTSSPSTSGSPSPTSPPPGPGSPSPGPSQSAAPA
jgi:hypothetical protein